MEYTLRSPKWEGDIRLKYHDNGFLAEATLPERMDLAAARHMAGMFPIHVSILRWFRENTMVKITAIEPELTFEDFWATYNQKRGSKIKAQQYWDGEKRTLNKRPITVSDRQDIMRMVKRYERRFKGDKKEFQPLASSFLHGRMWEAEMESMPRGKEVDLLKLIEERRKSNEQ